MQQFYLQYYINRYQNGDIHLEEFNLLGILIAVADVASITPVSRSHSLPLLLWTVQGCPRFCTRHSLTGITKALWLISLHIIVSSLPLSPFTLQHKRHSPAPPKRYLLLKSRHQCNEINPHFILNFLKDNSENLWENVSSTRTQKTNFHWWKKKIIHENRIVLLNCLDKSLNEQQWVRGVYPAVTLEEPGHIKIDVDARTVAVFKVCLRHGTSPGFLFNHWVGLAVITMFRMRGFLFPFPAQYQADCLAPTFRYCWLPSGTCLIWPDWYADQAAAWRNRHELGHREGGPFAWVIASCQENLVSCVSLARPLGQTYG